jgi:type III secretion system YscI/HrpB-like protein
MSIGPVAVTGASTPIKPFESHVRQQDADDFASMLGGNGGESGLGALNGFQADIGKAVDEISQVTRTPSAENLLRVQHAVMNVQAEFDLGVKLAGQLEQDINKLTSLQ